MLAHAANLCEVYYDACRRIGRVATEQLISDPGGFGRCIPVADWVDQANSWTHRKPGCSCVTLLSITPFRFAAIVTVIAVLREISAASQVPFTVAYKDSRVGDYLT